MATLLTAQGGRLPDNLVAELRARIQRYDESGDATNILDAGLHEQALELYDKLVRERTDVAAMVTLARWFTRRMILAGRSLREVQAVRLLSALAQQLDPAAVIPEAEPVVAPLSENAMALTLLDRFENHGELGALSRAKLLLTNARLTAERDRLADIEASMAVALAHQFITGDTLPDLDAAVTAAQDSLRLTAQGSESWISQIVVLTWVLLLRHERTGDLADLQEAIRIGRAAVQEIPPSNTDVIYVLSNLGNSLTKRYERLGSLSDLDEAIELIRKALRIAPAGLLDRVRILTSLSHSLMHRFRRLRDLQDGYEAVRVANSVVARAPSAGPLASWLLGNSAHVLALMFMTTGQISDADDAVRLSRQACEVSRPFERRRIGALSGHALIMLLRYSARESDADINEAVDAAREVVNTTGPDDPMNAMAASDLAMILSFRADVTDSVSDVDESIALSRHALTKLSPGNPARARALMVQANALKRRYELTRSPADLDATIGMFQSAANIRSGVPEMRMEAALSWSKLAIKTGDLAMAADAATTAVRLLPILAWRGHDRTTREQRLIRASGVAPNAAALAIQYGKPELAVELLEQGRSVLWSQALQTRTDLTDLRDAAPDLADLLDQARTALNEGESASPDRRRQAEQWEILVAEVRRLPGFGSFLTTTPFEQLSQAAVAGPVVIVNPSPFGSCALVVTPGNVTVIPLPWLDFNAATQRAQVLLAAQRDAERNRTPISRANLRQTMTSLLRWLWDTVADPVLSTIDTDRVHWCPTGPMTFLPLHAAGRYQKGHKSAGRTVPDRVVSSYTTTLTALLRSAAPSPDTPRLLAVGMPATPGLAPLPAVQDELTQIAASVPGASTLVGPAATEAAVLSELDRHSWVHFACHGTQNADNPAESAIHLHDAPLTVTKLAAHGLRNAELAYLSACHTATGSTQLADEAIHLTAALQAAGYRHVIGTQWSITDEHAADVAGAVYRELADPNVTRRDPAAALAHAVAPLRAAYQDRPEIWAPYIHTGPR